MRHSVDCHLSDVGPFLGNRFDEPSRQMEGRLGCCEGISWLAGFSGIHGASTTAQILFDYLPLISSSEKFRIAANDLRCWLGAARAERLKVVLKDC